MSKPAPSSMDQWMRRIETRLRELDRAGSRTSPLVTHWQKSNSAGTGAIPASTNWNGRSGWPTGSEDDAGFYGDNAYMSIVTDGSTYQGFRVSEPGIYRITSTISLDGGTPGNTYQQMRATKGTLANIFATVLAGSPKITASVSFPQTSFITAMAFMEKDEILSVQIRHGHAGTVVMTTDSHIWGEYLRP